MTGEDRVRTDLSDDGDEGGESRRKRKSRIILRNNATGIYSGVGGTFKVRNPSARLRCIVALGFRPDAGEPSNSNVAGWTGILQAFVKHGEQGGFYLPANSVIPGPAALSTALPWSYEFNSMVDQLRGDIQVPNAPGAGGSPGNLWVTASWEPTSAAVIGDEELRGIFKQCQLDIESSLVVSVTGA
jgi:hypothetical protein